MPVLVTERLELWRPQASDRAGLRALIGPGEVRRFLGGMEANDADVFARLLRNAGSWALYGYGTFMVRHRGRPEIVGNCGVFHSWRGFGPSLDDVAEAGWIVGKSAWGKGYAQEAMAAALDWFEREHGAQPTLCMIEQGHRASEAVAAKLGYVACDRVAEKDERPLIVYRRPAANSGAKPLAEWTRAQPA
ncbi:GNAT family N-acetyltransferase [Novosphingobium sp. Gsoil 351]|uniref:GNAT family N-acetyltransferase n=1 Tax=Novosphingobium sp. Gsoil 351 TaxID=2675225 RepID=UPI001E58DDC4|nr:GNAT family N-acetyltransferase [Novosphingobium sp. Gsoil 351]